MQNGQEPRETVQSVLRALDILGAFTVERPVLGVSEIASILGLNRTTVHRLLTTLENRGVVQRVPQGQKYTIGTQIVRLANVFFHYSDVRSVALPTIVSLRDATNQTAALHLRDAHHRMVIAQAESRQDLRVTYPDLGTPIPLHVGAPGKAILAHLRPDEIEYYFRTESLTSVVVNTPISEAALRDELERIRTDGYSITSQERRLGVLSIAAPIFNATGAVIASVNVSAPLQRVTQEQVAEFSGLVLRAGRTISAQLGYQDGGVALHSSCQASLA
jgi:IclR family acetate operon transcriptional repressor